MAPAAVEQRMPAHQTGLLFVYFLLSGITWVYGPIGSGILGRLSLADLWMIVVVSYCGLYVLRTGRVYWRGLFTCASLLMVVQLLAVTYSRQPLDGIIEWLVHIYLLVGAVAIYQLIVPLPIDERLRIIKVWMVATSLLGLAIVYDGLSQPMGLPILSPYHIPGAAVGTFRNTGQAGTYMGTALALGLPLLSICERRDRMVVALTVLICVLALILTVKRAATIGFVLGLVLAILANLHRAEIKKYLVLMVVAVVLVQGLLSFLASGSEHYASRLDRKWNIVASGELENDWLERHYGTVAEVIANNPLFGAGTAGFDGVYTDKEVHSTYLNVITSMGFLGFLVYLIFLASVLHTFWAPKNEDPRARRLRLMLVPMVLGLIVSWSYTYHLRKREFWVMAVLAAAVMAPAPREAASARRIGRSPRAPMPGGRVAIDVPGRGVVGTTIEWRTGDVHER